MRIYDFENYNDEIWNCPFCNSTFTEQVYIITHKGIEEPEVGVKMECFECIKTYTLCFNISDIKNLNSKID